jgi:alpha-ribazole phosphatase CobZ
LSYNFKTIKTGLSEVDVRIVYHSYENIPVKSLLLSFESPKRAISTREGMVELTGVVNNSNPPPLWNVVHQEWGRYSEIISRDLGYEREKLAFLSTIADADNLGKCEEGFREFHVVSLATVDVSVNALRMGADKATFYEKDGSFHEAGTVNIIVLTNASLTDGALARSLINITEAKVRAFQDMDIRSTYTPMENQATGTSTDNIVVISGNGPSIGYLGGHSKMGELIASPTYEAVKQAASKEAGLHPHRPLENRLLERGISINELVKTGMEMYIPDPEMDDREKVGRLLKGKILSSFDDVNICSLVIAGLKLEDEGRRGAIPGLSENEYQKDLVHLMADEILGIQIATYIGGTKALFEFERFDRKKPGILGKLPPILDDVMGGLISGCLVSVCSELYEKRK